MLLTYIDYYSYFSHIKVQKQTCGFVNHLTILLAACAPSVCLLRT